MTIRETTSHFVDEFDDHTRAFLQVQQGCDHRYCIIPMAEGHHDLLVSVPCGGSVQKLVENGTNEVVLTGVDITSWGHDLPNSRA